MGSTKNVYFYRRTYIILSSQLLFSCMSKHWMWLGVHPTDPTVHGAPQQQKTDFLKCLPQTLRFCHLSCLFFGLRRNLKKKKRETNGPRGWVIYRCILSHPSQKGVSRMEFLQGAGIRVFGSQRAIQSRVSPYFRAWLPFLHLLPVKFLSLSHPSFPSIYPPSDFLNSLISIPSVILIASF